jgi:predicted Zn-dependent protease
MTIRARRLAATPWGRCGAVLVLLLPGAAAAHPEIAIQVENVNARLAVEPRNPELFLERGELYRIHQEWAAAEADYMKARELAPGLARVDLMLGNLKLDAGRPAEARGLLDRFLAREPDHVMGRIARGRALAQLGEPLAAARDFTHALEHLSADDAQPEYYLERARALVAAGPAHTEAAVAGLDEGLARLGQPVSLQLYAIDLELARGRTDAALERLERIAAAAPRPESWQLKRAEILERAGRLDEARLALRATLDALATLPEARRESSAARKLREQAQSALARLDRTP